MNYGTIHNISTIGGDNFQGRQQRRVVSQNPNPKIAFLILLQEYDTLHTYSLNRNIQLFYIKLIRLISSKRHLSMHILCRNKNIKRLLCTNLS